MVNSATQSLAEFKSKQLGGLLSGTSSTVTTPSPLDIQPQAVSAQSARTAPKKSSTAFLDKLRDSGKGYHDTVLSGIQARKAAAAAAAAAQQRSVGTSSGGGTSYPTTGYRQPSGGNGDRKSKQGAYGYQPFAGRYGLTVPASSAMTALEGAYKQAFGQGFVVNNGWRGVEEEQQLWNDYQAGRGPIASKPGTGVHGYGTAVDINGPISNANSKQHSWLRQNAAKYGWYWIGERFGEPWHWEYYG